MLSKNLNERIKKHAWRMRFAFLPVNRVVLNGKYIEYSGFYWWRIIVEVKCGLLQEWTAYAEYNDNIKFSEEIK